VVNEVWVLGEILLLAVLEDKETAFRKEGTGGVGKDEVGQLGELGQGVGRVGKDEVVGAGGTAEEAQDIGAQQGDVVFCLQGLQEAADETDVLGIQLHGGDVGAAAGEEFKGDAAGAGKEVQGTWGIAFEVDIGAQDIEQVFLGEVRGGTRLESAWDVEVATPVFSCNDSHEGDLWVYEFANLQICEFTYLQIWWIC